MIPPRQEIPVADSAAQHTTRVSTGGTVLAASAQHTSVRHDTSATARRTGYALSTVAVLFLLLDGIMKLLGLPVVADTMMQLGFAPALATTFGTILLAAVVLYVIPRTSLVGAILLTGYLGGAVATHVRVGNPLASHILFPAYLGTMLWGGLYLRDARLRALISIGGPTQ